MTPPNLEWSRLVPFLDLGTITVRPNGHASFLALSLYPIFSDLSILIMEKNLDRFPNQVRFLLVQISSSMWFCCRGTGKPIFTKNGFPAFFNFTFKLVSCSHHSFVFRDEVSEDEGCCPDTREPDQCINDPAHYGDVAAEEPAHDVEPEDPNAAPDDGSDNGEGEGYFVDYIHG